MIALAKKATPAAIAVLRQATAHFPKRKKASDGLLPSAAHVHQNPNSDHNSGYAVDITHDPVNGVDCVVAFVNFQNDPRVKYLIFAGRIWSKEKGSKVYTGPNKHEKHLHISIKETCGEDTSPWFYWLSQPKTINKVKAVVRPLPKKKETK
jgi:hypothetical protein